MNRLSETMELRFIDFQLEAFFSFLATKFLFPFMELEVFPKAR